LVLKLTVIFKSGSRGRKFSNNARKAYGTGGGGGGRIFAQKEKASREVEKIVAFL
jgi:hypothetical protein